MVSPLSELKAKSLSSFQTPLSYYLPLTPRSRIINTRKFYTVGFSSNGGFIGRSKENYVYYRKETPGSANFTFKQLPIRLPKNFTKVSLHDVNDGGDYVGRFAKSKRGSKRGKRRRAIVGFSGGRPTLLQRLAKAPEGCRFEIAETITNSGIIIATGFCKKRGHKMHATFTLSPQE